MKHWLRQFFLPSAENSYAPHSLHKMAVALMFVLILLTFTVTNIQSFLWMASDWMVSTILPAVIVKETNEERASDNLPTLRRNAVLDEAATLKAKHMAKNQYFAHYSPDGMSPWYWFGQVGYNFVHAGENLAVHFTDSSEVVEAWMDSPTHRANIMNGDFLEIGIGTAEGEYEGFKTVYVVQLFGTPAKAAPSVAGETVAVAQPPVISNVEEVSINEDEEVDQGLLEEDVESPEAVILSDEAAVKEDIEIIPADPIPVAVTDVTSDTVKEPVPHFYLSDFISTSTGGIPATLSDLTEETTPAYPVSTVASALTKPQMVMQFVYFVIAGFVIIALLLSILIEIRHQRPMQIAYGLMLLGTMGGLLYVHILLTSGVVIA